MNDCMHLVSVCQDVSDVQYSLPFFDSSLTLNADGVKWRRQIEVLATLPDFLKVQFNTVRVT